MTRFLLCGAAMIAATASPAMAQGMSQQAQGMPPAQGMSPNAAMAPAGTPTPAEYVAAAGASDQYEIQSSRLVLDGTRDARVREFANMMVRHHTASTRDVAAAASRARVAVPSPAPDAEQARMLADLRAATGPARDTLYWQQQRMAHEKALALHQGYAGGGTSAPLKQAAAKITPVVQQHLTMLQSAR